MQLIFHHRNKSEEFPFVRLLSDEIQKQYEHKLANAVQDIQTVSCTFEYGVKDWKPENCFYCTLHGASKKSKTTDIKWSVFRGMIDCAVKKQFAYMETARVRLIVEADTPDKPKEEQISTYGKHENLQLQEMRLNVEPIEPRYSLSQLVLSDSTAAELHDVITLIKKRNLIYNEWGFADVDPITRSVVNFYGPPGTGKTMAAHAVVKELGMPFLPLNYSDIESKYVGDAPKNLVAAFAKAKETDAALFFDEADSFLGKRITNVSSSSDQAINSLRSQMLILLESHSGIVFFATNLKENYDTAFESRILKHIGFQLPDKNARIKIIDKHIPAKAPFDKEHAGEEFWNTLGDISEGLAPRELKNLVLNTLIKGAAQEPPQLSPALFISVFTEDKQKRDEARCKKEERRKQLSANIKENIETKNYTVITAQECELKEEPHEFTQQA